MIASTSMAARDSRRVSVLSRVISHDRSPAVRKVHLLATRTRLTPRGACAGPAPPDRRARRRRTTALPAAAIPPAGLQARSWNRRNVPRHLPCAFPRGSPWLGLLLPLTRPRGPERTSPRMLAADAYENTAARTPLSGSVPSRLPAPAQALRQSSRQIRSPSARDRRHS